jgi:hypothetical protein
MENVKAGLLLSKITPNTRIRVFVDGEFEKEYPNKAAIPAMLLGVPVESYGFDYSYDGNIPVDAQFGFDVAWDNYPLEREG